MRRSSWYWLGARAFAAQQKRVARGLARSRAGTPSAYEQACAAELERAGWRARTVGRSGDQGADVIATMGGTKLVLQCKAWSKPVSNRAVQEAYAAKVYQQANYAAVVTEIGFTNPARDLAQKTGVLLLRQSSLRGISSRMQIDDRPTLIEWIVDLVMRRTVR